MARPTKMDEKTLAKLTRCFAKGFTDEEACIVAKIDPTTLYRYCDDHKDYARMKELLKKTPNIYVKNNLIRLIKKKDYDATKFWAETRMKDEFSKMMQVGGQVNMPEIQKLTEIIQGILTPKKK